MITCVGGGNAIIPLHAAVLRASRLTLDLMDTAIKHILMIVMWQSGVPSHSILGPKRDPLHSLLHFLNYEWWI